MSAYIPESLRNRIAQSDRQRCCYCLTSEANNCCKPDSATVDLPIAAKVKKYEVLVGKAGNSLNFIMGSAAIAA